jgi:hypothetical protein
VKARVALLSIVAFAAAACSGGSSSGGDTNTAQTSPPPQVTTTPSATPPPTVTPSAKPTPSFSSTVQASHRCLTSALGLSLGQGQGAAGSTIVPIVLTNTGGEACTLFGRPGVSFTDGNGNQLGVGAVFGGSAPATVTLAPGDKANALLKIPDPGNFSASDCAAATSAKLRVYPPGDKASLEVAYQASVCTTKQGAAQVSPMTPGSGG